MRIKSCASRNIFWRVFNWDDALCAIGLQEGIVSPTQYVDWNHPAGRMKIEIKVHDINGQLIVAAGPVFWNADGVEVYDDHIIEQRHVVIPNVPAHTTPPTPGAG